MDQKMLKKNKNPVGPDLSRRSFSEDGLFLSKKYMCKKYS